jgi:hypothetical protein
LPENIENSTRVKTFINNGTLKVLTFVGEMRFTVSNFCQKCALIFFPLRNIGGWGGVGVEVLLNAFLDLVLDEGKWVRFSHQPV